MDKRTTVVVLSALCLLSYLLGSVHAFSVLTAPLEKLTGADRASVSLIYSLALVCLTLAVLTGYRFYSRLAPAHLIAASVVLACAGLLLAAASESLFGWIVGFSILFGFANGVGYGFGLQMAARVMPRSAGFAMSLVTAFYALGAISFSFVLQQLLERVGIAGSLHILAASVALAGLGVAFVVSASGARYELLASDSGARADSNFEVSIATTVQLWFAYGLAVTAGLMAIGHAASIIGVYDASPTVQATGAMSVAAGNGAGGFLLAIVIDRWSTRGLLISLPLASAAALFALAFTSSVPALLGCLAIIGFCYGALIALYPYAINSIVGTEAGPRIYGRVFTAWGIAGLCAPWLAGFLYDHHSSYVFALCLAGLCALGSAIAVVLFAKRWTQL